MFPAGTPFTPPNNVANRVAGQINTTTTGFGGSAGIIEMWYHFVVRGEGRNFTFAFVNSAGPVKESLGTGSPRPVSLSHKQPPVTNRPTIAPAAPNCPRPSSTTTHPPHTALPMC